MWPELESKNELEPGENSMSQDTKTRKEGEEEERP